MTIKVRDRRQAMKILRCVYEKDDQAVYYRWGSKRSYNAVHGGFLNAVYDPDEQIVNVWSGALQEHELKWYIPQFFQNDKYIIENSFREVTD